MNTMFFFVLGGGCGVEGEGPINNLNTQEYLYNMVNCNMVSYITEFKDDTKCCGQTRM